MNRQSSGVKNQAFNPSPGSIKIGSKRSLKLLMEDLVPNANFINRHQSIFIQPGSTKSLLPNLGILGSERRFSSIVMASPQTMREIEKKDRAARSIFLRANELAQHVTFEKPKNFGDVIKFEDGLLNLRKRSSKDQSRKQAVS